MESITSFFLELDALKSIHRRTYVNSGERKENSAEHSWHLAMSCWAISRYFDLGLSEEKLLKLALIHDLGEIDAGDTFLYSSNRDSAHKKERECVKRLANHPGNQIHELSQLWEEQESGASRETKLLKVVDRLLPFLHNLSSKGKAWQELDIKKEKVINAHAFIANDFPQIHSWMVKKLDEAVKAGWLSE